MVACNHGTLSYGHEVVAVSTRATLLSQLMVVQYGHASSWWSSLQGSTVHFACCVTGYMHRMCRRSCAQWDSRAAALTGSIAPPAHSPYAADFASASSFRLGPSLASHPEVGSMNTLCAAELIWPK